MGFSLWSGRVAGNGGAQRGGGRAKVGVAAAAILDQEADQRVKALGPGAIDDRAAVARGIDQPGAGEDGEVGRQGVGRHRQPPRHLAGGQPARLVRHQQAEHVEPRGLGQRRQGEQGVFGFHISTIYEMTKHRQTGMRGDPMRCCHAIPVPGLFTCRSCCRLTKLRVGSIECAMPHSRIIT